MLSTLPTRKNSTHQARFILCEVSHTRSAETPQPSSSRFRTAITIPPNVAIASPSIHQQTTDRTSWERGKRSYTLLPTAHPRAPPPPSQLHHLQFINNLHIEQ